MAGKEGPGGATPATLVHRTNKCTSRFPEGESGRVGGDNARMTLTGDQHLVKRINRMALVRLLREEPGLSRADLSTLSGLTKSTNSIIAKELIDEGWLLE